MAGYEHGKEREMPSCACYRATPYGLSVATVLRTLGAPAELCRLFRVQPRQKRRRLQHGMI
jgi:hypothetical protein